MSDRICSACGLGEPAVTFYAGKKRGRCAACCRIRNTKYRHTHRNIPPPEPVAAAASEVDAITRAWGRS